MNLDEYTRLLGTTSSQGRYFQILIDKQFHCRRCAQTQIHSGQLAGGGGVQGLERGTKSRPGIVIISKRDLCPICNKCDYFDRWTGEFKVSNAASSIPRKIKLKILNYYSYTDCIECRRRTAAELVIDHRFPMERWGSPEIFNYNNITDTDIQQRFQLLKKDSFGNHNLLKSRACEHCLATGKRGYPFGIKFYYAGSEEWPSGCPSIGPAAEQGCIGCGWYDISRWRYELNRLLLEQG